MKRPVEFYSEGFKLQGDVYTPSDVAPGEQRGAVLLCHGYTGVKDLYLPDNARVLNDSGYVVMAFDYKGWGQSEGVSPLRLAPHSRVSDVQAAMTFLGEQPEVDEDRIGIYGTSYGGATVVWTAAIDQRAKCVVSVVGIGHGARWMSRVRRMDEWFDLLDRSKADRIQRVMTGKSDMVERGEILLPDRQSAALAAAQRANNPNAVMTIPVEYIDDTLGFNPEWVVGQISPRPRPVHHQRPGPPGAAGRVGTALRPCRRTQKTCHARGRRPLRGLRGAGVLTGHAPHPRLVPAAHAGEVLNLPSNGTHPEGTHPEGTHPEGT